MTPANYIALAALFVSTIVGITSIINVNRTQKRAEQDEKAKEEDKARKEQAEETSILFALENIKTMLTDIKNEINTVKTDARANHDAIIKLEQSCQSAHIRIDKHEERLNRIEEALRERKEG